MSRKAGSGREVLAEASAESQEFVVKRRTPPLDNRNAESVLYTMSSNISYTLSNDGASSTVGKQQQQQHANLLSLTGSGVLSAPLSPGANSIHSRASHATTNTTSNNNNRGKALVSPIVSSCQHLLQPNGSINGNLVAKALLPNFPSLDSAIPQDNFSSKQGLLSVDDKMPVTHGRIREFIMGHVGPTLHELGYGRGHRIALVLPNGPELALAIFSISNWACCVPLNANGATVELQKDLRASKAAMVIGMAFDSAPIQDMARALKIPFCGLQPSEKEAGIFQLVPSPASAAWAFTGNDQGRRPFRSIGKQGRRSIDDDIDGAGGTGSCIDIAPACNDSLFANKSLNDDPSDANKYFLPNEHDDECLLLFTSGTTGNKKLVPHSLGDMLIAAAVIAVSWDLSPDDVNCNLMPLFHVGGIVRQVFAPILSAGSVICCPAFDPTVFWNLLVEGRFTWYYAAPTMHQIILANQPPLEAGGNRNLRMIANAAGGLLPSLAQELRRVFGANVLPSYGMTECMPISSPPSTYELEKPGTSGVAVGPQIAIFSSNYEVLPPGREGSICVRGRPCFRGYGGVSMDQCFLEGGWFNTGDLGYLDEDGYLYITGRSKEVINRGGEIISPMEVEEAVLQHPSVRACLAFSANHDVLQEVVGIVLVPDPEVPKIDLPTLHTFLQERLTTQKWPQCLVYMDGLPKSHTNKLLRVKLGTRLNLPTFSDHMLPIERTFNARCPPQGTGVGVSIPCNTVTINPQEVQQALEEELGLIPNDAPLNGNGEIYDSFVHVKAEDATRQLLVVPHPTKFGSLVVHVWNLDRIAVIQIAKDCLDCYLIPSHIVQCQGPPNIDSLTAPQTDDAIGSILQDSTLAVDPMVQEFQEMVRDLLDLDCLPAPDTNFFHVGGSSLMASQLASRIRKMHNCCFTGADVFRQNSCIAMAKHVKAQQVEFEEEELEQNGSFAASEQNGPNSNRSTMSRRFSSAKGGFPLGDVPLEAERLKPQSGFIRSIFQLIPLFVAFPLWQFLRFFLFFMTLLAVMENFPWGPRLLKFVLTVVGYHFLWVTVTPLIFVAIKWIVIGRYRPGRHAVWSWYYLRWWFVDCCRKLFGYGLWGSHDTTLGIILTLLGANIGDGARISLVAEIAEYDLVTIGDNAKVEDSTVRGFGVDNGAIIFGPVTIGNNSSVGAKSVIAPFTSIPDGTHLGPCTSSYEVTPGKFPIGDNNPTANNDTIKHCLYNRQALPEPSTIMQTLVCHPILWIVDTISHIPAMVVLYFMITFEGENDTEFKTVNELMEWLCDPHRVPFYILIRVVRAVIAPLLYMAGAIVVKRLIIGKFEPGPRDTTSEWQLCRHWLAAKLFCRENMQDFTDLIGRHYELTSVMYRMLGAKVGKRVFWPGHQPVFSGEFDLLEVGDDVVFGSRTCIFVATVDSLEKVVFCAGANVSDNTVVLPGSIVGKNAVLGSNTVCPRGWYLPEASIWLGANGGEPMLLERGVEKFDSHVLVSDIRDRKLQMQGDDSTLRPFGKAVELGESSYFVLPVSLLVFVKMVSCILFAALHALPLIACLHLGAGILYGGFPVRQRDYATYDNSALQIFWVLLSVYFGTHAARCLIVLTCEIAGKWVFMGRRQEGRYNWYVQLMLRNWSTT